MGWCRFQLTLFYTFQCGFYIYSVAALLVWETRRKDFSVMMTHHIVTIGLIAYSYITGYVCLQHSRELLSLKSKFVLCDGILI